MENEKEIWLPVVRYEGYYAVSNQGRIKAVGAFIKHDGNFNGGYYKKVKIREHRIDRYGYCLIKLCRDGKCKTLKVHRLVAAAFIANPNKYPQVDHVDGNKQNNNVENLNWVSAAENMKRAWNTGLKNNHYLRGEGSPHAKITKDKVLELRLQYAAGYSRVELANLYKISSSMVRDIVTNKTWNYV